MNEITITAEMTLKEFYACHHALQYGKGVRNACWTLVAFAAASLASSAAITWGTPASVLAGLALAGFAVSFYLSGFVYNTQVRNVYKRYRESTPTYTFTSERILATSRFAQGSYAWEAVNRVMELRTVYVLAVRNWFICVPKRDIPAEHVDDFIALLNGRGYKIGTLGAASARVTPR